MERDIYFKKIVAFDYAGLMLSFRASQALFSSHAVDVGTARLLRSLLSADISACNKILDLGCGYGPLGLTLKAADSSREVHMVDRDALAVAYTRQNAALNQLAGVKSYGSLGYDDVQDTDFDLIVSNIPGKAGETAIQSWLLGAYHYLKSQGMVAIVVVTPLEAWVESVLAAPGVHIMEKISHKGHTIFYYQFTPGFESSPRPEQRPSSGDIYHRADVAFEVGDQTVMLRTAKGLPEFDTLSYRSILMLKNLLKLPLDTVQHALMFTPVQGHLAVALWQRFAPQSLTLVDRDLLSLRYTKNNLLANGCPEERILIYHQIGTDTGIANLQDLIVGLLREDEGTEGIALAVRQAAQQLAPQGTMLIAGSSTAVTRLEKVLKAEKRLRAHKRRRYKGRSLLILKHA